NLKSQGWLSMNAKSFFISFSQDCAKCQDHDHARPSNAISIELIHFEAANSTVLALAVQAPRVCSNVRNITPPDRRYRHSLFFPFTLDSVNCAPSAPDWRLGVKGYEHSESCRAYLNGCRPRSRRRW